MKQDEFSRPLSARSTPDGLVPEVWAAFVRTYDYTTPEERREKWQAYIALQRKYYDENGNRKPNPENG